jgi:hypothetical protein
MRTSRSVQDKSDRLKINKDCRAVPEKSAEKKSEGEAVSLAANGSGSPPKDQA